MSSQQATITAEQTNSASARVANLNKRASLTQLPEPDDTPQASLSMASGDFDENGVPDLVVGSAGSGSFALNLYQGNTDSIYADGRGSNNNSNIALSLLPVKSIPLFVSPDFLAGGDFDGDGHHDLATAARGGDVVYLLSGNGHGDFLAARRIELPGRVTTLSATEKETGNLTGLAVGVVDERSPAALIFKTLPGSGETSPAVVRTSSEVTCIAFRRSSFRNWTEVLIGAGKELLVSSLDRTDDASFARHLSFSSPIRSIAVGSFGGGNGLDVAVLTADGALNQVFETESGQLIRGRNWGIFPSATHLIRARISGSDSDDLIAVDPQAHRLQLLVADAPTALDSQSAVRNRFVGSVDLEGEPVALLPMRLNEDALSDLVILKAGRAAPVSLQITAAMTFVVLNTNDSGAGSLRQAILDANSNPGTDTINFNIVGLAPHIINLLSPFPAVTESVTINGASQPDFAGTPVVELNGTSAGVAANGLTISASSSVVRGLVINGFSGHGIVVNVNGNIVERNFIGVDSTGTFALENGLDGVFINGGSNNTIGGTTASARNVISGNRNGIQIIGLGTGNKIRGNFIGTNAAGTSLLGNSSNGVLINGSSGNSIGEVGSLSANRIALNGFAGVSIASGTGNSIQSNSIFSNGGLGIDLGPTGVTPNDSGDPDGGANNLQNFPVLNSASAAVASTTIQGTLNSTAATTFRIEFFSNQMPNPSGFGEGQAFIGAINVTTDATGNANFTQNFPVAVPSQQVIAAIATDSAGNTSEFSRAIQVGSVCPTLQITCPGNITQQCSGTVSYPQPVVTGNCQGFTVVCSPPSGSVFGTGTTIVTCVANDASGASASCSFTISVTNPPPQITCPGNIVRTSDLGQCSSVVIYPPPVLTSICPANVVCSPPSGSAFAIGVTTVTCTAVASGATASCSFTVTVNDLERISILCPGNVSVTAPAGQCSQVVTFPTPGVIDNCPGATVSCVPPSGSTFSLGVTNVLCTAVDVRGVQATCSFTVTVISPPLALVKLEGNKPFLEFGPIPASRKFRKFKKQPVRTFIIENGGCTPLVICFDSLNRVGPDVDRGFISDPDDRKLFDLSIVDPVTGTERPLEILTDLTLNPGQKQNFKLRFNPLIPPVDTNGSLSADEVLPDLITSVLTFILKGGAPLKIDLIGHVDTNVVLIDPDNPRRFPEVNFLRSGNEFIVEYSIFDSNLDVNKVDYQFFGNKERPAGDPITVDLAPLVRQSDFVTGQSFTIVQRFTGAKDHPEILGVAVTVSDNESSFSVNSVPGAGASAQQVILKSAFSLTSLFPLELNLPGGKRRSN